MLRILIMVCLSLSIDFFDFFLRYFYNLINRYIVPFCVSLYLRVGVGVLIFLIFFRYFRGKRVLDAVLDVLLTDHGLSQAEEVLLSGGSAGGLSTYLHADDVKTRLPSTVTK